MKNPTCVWRDNRIFGFNKFNHIVFGLNFQRVHHLHVDRTVIVLVGDFVHLAIFQNLVTGLICHVKEETTVTLSFHTGNHRLRSILTIDNGTAVFLLCVMRNTDIRLTGIFRITDITTACKERGLLPFQSMVGILLNGERKEVVVTIRQNKEVIFLVVNQLCGGGCKRIFCYYERVSDTLIFTVDLKHWCRGSDSIIIDPIHQLADTVLDITLGNQTDFVKVTDIGSAHVFIGALINHITFESILSVIFNFFERGAVTSLQ